MALEDLKLVAGNDISAMDAGVGRQRRIWSTPEKLAMVEMADQQGSSVAEVAEAFGVAPSQIYSWRKRLASGEFDGDESEAVFARVAVDEQSDAAASLPGKIVIVFPSGARMRVEGMVDPASLGMVLNALAR